MKHRLVVYVDSEIIKSAKKRSLDDIGKVNLSFITETFLKDYAEHKIAIVKQVP